MDVIQRFADSGRPVAWLDYITDWWGKYRRSAGEDLPPRFVKNFELGKVGRGTKVTYGKNLTFRRRINQFRRKVERFC